MSATVLSGFRQLGERYRGIHDPKQAGGIRRMQGRVQSLEDYNALDQLARLVLRVLAEFSPCTERSLVGWISGAGSPSERWQAPGTHALELIRHALLKLGALGFIQCAQGRVAITEDGRRALQDLRVACLQPREASAADPYARLLAFATALRVEYVLRLGRFCQFHFAQARAITEPTWAKALQIWSCKVAPGIRSKAGVLAQLAKASRARAEASPAFQILQKLAGVPLSKMAKLGGRLVNAQPHAGVFLFLLVCGALSLAGAVVFSSGKSADSSPARESAFLASNPAESSRESPIVWLHDGQDPLARSILLTRRLEGATWIEGLAIRGENASSQTLTGLEGVIKTDSGEEIRLRVSTEGSQGNQTAAQDIPAGAKFTLESAFQPDGGSEQIGMPAEDFLSNYGGLILRVNWTLGSVQTTLIEYFSTSQLRAQLADAS